MNTNLNAIPQEIITRWEKRSVASRRQAPAPEALRVKMMGVDLPVDIGVNPEDVLPCPEGYRLPSKGPARDAATRAVFALAQGRNCFIWGMPGTGKDAIVHAFSAWTRRPVLMVTFRPGVDLAPWFYTRSYSADGGTGWEYGALWTALTQGVMGRDGKRRPAMILLSDVDRADSAQAEWFRILTDSISGRILGPDGKMVAIVKGTQFVCTANSCGSGDSRGRMASANVMDASILDRLGRAIEFSYLHWDDEVQVLREKFPVLAEKAPTLFPQLKGCCEALRKAIAGEELYAEFTHRGICEVLLECQDRVTLLGKVEENVLKKGFDAWLHRLDADNRLAAKRLISPFLNGGALEDGEEG
jgi:hypothetical protein